MDIIVKRPDKKPVKKTIEGQWSEIKKIIGSESVEVRRYKDSGVLTVTGPKKIMDAYRVRKLLWKGKDLKPNYTYRGHTVCDNVVYCRECFNGGYVELQGLTTNDVRIIKHFFQNGGKCSIL